MTREVVRKVVAVGWYPYVPFDQQEHPKLLSDDTGKTTGVLDQDRADTVALDAIKLNNNAPFFKVGRPPFSGKSKSKKGLVRAARMALGLIGSSWRSDEHRGLPK